MKTTILIAGGSGLIGSRLIQYFSPDKYEFKVLSRRSLEDHDNVSYFKWDTDLKTIDVDSFEEIDVVINLAGAGIADKRWTKKRKEEILNSRIASVNTLCENIKKINKKLPLYIGASAIGFYGNKGNRELHENDVVGQTYLADVTQAWEQAHKKLETQFHRSCILRIGIVLSTKGGALKEILKPANLGMYGYFGNGQAYYSWIHIDDICNIIEHQIQNDNFEGTYNLTAPRPVTIKELIKAVKAAKKGMGIVMPVPAFMLKLALGQMAEMLIASTRVIPKRLLDQDYEFKFDDPINTVRDLLEKNI